MIDVHAYDPAFGYRLIHDELTLTQGLRVGLNRVARLCREHSVFSGIIKRRSLVKVAGPVVQDDHVQHQFRIMALDRAWFTDITKHHTREGKLYVCAVMDVCSNRIVGLSIGPRMTSNLVSNALH